MIVGLLLQLGSEGRLSGKVLYSRNLIESREYPCRYQGEQRSRLRPQQMKSPSACLLVHERTSSSSWS